MQQEWRLFLQLPPFSKEQGVREPDEEQRGSVGPVRHPCHAGLPGDLGFGGLEAAGRRRGVPAGHQVQQHREPEEHQSHLHRLPGLPHSLKAAADAAEALGLGVWRWECGGGIMCFIIKRI